MDKKKYVKPSIKEKRLEYAECILAASNKFEEGETINIGNGGGSSDPNSGAKFHFYDEKEDPNAAIWH